MAYPSIRLYYPGGKAGSFGALAEGYIHAFKELGITYAALDYRVPPDEDGFGVGGGNYDIGIYIGEPTHLGLLHMHARHKEKFLVLAPNGYGIKSVILDSCKKLCVTPLAPSEWAADVIQHETGVRPEVAPHGVHLVLPKGGTRRYLAGEMEALREHWGQIGDGMRGAKMDLVHFTSTATDRKGTLSILRAMDEHHMSDLCSLEIKCDPHVAPAIEDIVSGLRYRARREIVINPESIPNDGSLAWYIDGFDAVLQPSRAEGFGLVPLEAASIGVPAILTLTTGHKDFCWDLDGSEGVESRPTVFDEVESFDDSGDKYVPTDGEEFYGSPLDPYDIFVSVGRMRDNLPARNHYAIANSFAIRQKWSWTAVVKKWLEGREK